MDIDRGRLIRFGLRRLEMHFKLFALNASRDFGERVAAVLSNALAAHKGGDFEALHSL